MSQYRRFRIPGVTYYFTVNLARRGEQTLTDHIDLLRWSFRATMQEQPVYCDAMVVLPDHIHAVWTLPEGDADFSNRWRKIKARFSHGLGQRRGVSQSKLMKREVGIWQRRFWEHCVRDDASYQLAIEHCLLNPVKHGLVEHPEDWAFSSIHRDLREGRQVSAFSGAEVGKLPTLQAAL